MLGFPGEQSRELSTASYPKLMFNKMDTIRWPTKQTTLKTPGAKEIPYLSCHLLEGQNLNQKRLGKFKILHMGVSKNSGTPKWMVKIMEIPIKIDDLGVPLFSETPTYRKSRSQLENTLTSYKKGTTGPLWPECYLHCTCFIFPSPRVVEIFKDGFKTPLSCITQRDDYWKVANVKIELKIQQNRNNWSCHGCHRNHWCNHIPNDHSIESWLVHCFPCLGFFFTSQ